MNKDRASTLFFILTLVFAALVLFQAGTGFLMQQTVPLQSKWIRERPEQSLRFKLPDALRPAPRFASVEPMPSFFVFQSYVSLDGIRIEQMFSKKDIGGNLDPCFVWTMENLWVGLGMNARVGASEEHLAVVTPRPVPLYLVLAAAFLPLAVWLLLSQTARRLQGERWSRMSRLLCAGLGQTPVGEIAGRAGSSMLARLLMVVFVLLAIAVSTDHGRPIWHDEMMHFGLGACHSVSEAWNAICKIGYEGINRGQTGIYMLLDYFLLKLFGASSFVLRLPSLISGILLLFGAGQFLRVRGFGAPWHALVIIAIVAQSSLVYYIAEARPYLPLAAAAVGTLAYYVSPLALRSTLMVRVLGVASIGWGVLMHPYFSVYWLMSYLFGFWLALREGQVRWNLRSMLQFANPIVSLVGVAVYFTLGKLTWMLSMRDFHESGFWILGRENYWQQFIDGTHLQFLGSNILRMMVLALVAMLALACALSVNVRRRMGSLLPPVMLIVASLSAALLISGISYMHSTPIIPRQWIASQAFIPIAFTWLLGESFQRFSARFPATCLAALALLLAPVLDQALSCSKINILKTSSYLQSTGSDHPLAPVDKRDADNWFYNSQQWVILANQNIAAGGVIWPEFLLFYEHGFDKWRAVGQPEAKPQ